MKALSLERYRDRIAGVLTCYNRIVIMGTLSGACYAAGMTSFLNARHIRIFDYPIWSRGVCRGEPWRVTVPQFLAINSAEVTDQHDLFNAMHC